MIVVSDTSCISNLMVIVRLELLNSLFGKVLIPEAVYAELVELRKFHPNLIEFHSYPWMEVTKVENLELVESLQKKLDHGESEAIALAKELSADALKIDELQGRSIAVNLGIPVIGLLGILIQAKKKGLVELLVKPILVELRDKAGFWISEDLLLLVLLKVDEN